MTRESFIRKWLGNKDKTYTDHFKMKMRDDLDKVINRAMSVTTPIGSLEEYKEFISWHFGYSRADLNQMFEDWKKTEHLQRWSENSD